jgi:hypothetical protein
MSKARAYCFTINNYSDEEKKLVRELMTKGAKYVVCGEEVCPTTGTPHLQGYVAFHNARGIKAINKLIGNRAHLVVANGTAEQNKKYCEKDGKNLYEAGEMPKQGKRNDIAIYRSAVKAGKSNKQLMEDDDTLKVWARHPMLRNRMRNAMCEDIARTNVKVYVFYGASNTGKSYYASRAAPNAYWKEASKWWDGYDGESTIIMDEFNGSWFPYDTWKRVLDHYKYQGEIKGGSIAAAWTSVYIISNVHPSCWYADGKWNKLQTQRRITSVYRMDCDGVAHFEESEKTKDTLSTDDLGLDGQVLVDIDWDARDAAAAAAAAAAAPIVVPVVAPVIAPIVQAQQVPIVQPPVAVVAPQLPGEASDQEEDEETEDERDEMEISSEEEDSGIDIENTDDESDEE